MDNVGSLRYSGRLFQTTGPDTVKARRPYVENLKGGTTSLLLLEDLRQWVTRRPGWRWNEQFIQVFRSSTVKTVIQGVCPRQFCLLWAPAQRKRATMLYFANVFFYLFFYGRLILRPWLTEVRENFTRGRPWVSLEKLGLGFFPGHP